MRITGLQDVTDPNNYKLTLWVPVYRMKDGYRYFGDRTYAVEEEAVHCAPPREGCVVEGAVRMEGTYQIKD